MALIRFCRRPRPEATNPRRHGKVDVVRQQCHTTDGYYFITLLLFLFLPCFSFHHPATKVTTSSSTTAQKSIVFTLHVGPYARISTGPSKICSFIHPPDGLSKNQHLTTLLRHGYGGLDGRRNRFKCRPHPDPTRLPKLRRKDHSHTIERRMTPSTLK